MNSGWFPTLMKVIIIACWFPTLMKVIMIAFLIVILVGCIRMIFGGCS